MPNASQISEAMDNRGSVPKASYQAAQVEFLVFP
jgi:hypothetical protein